MNLKIFKFIMSALLICVSVYLPLFKLNIDIPTFLTVFSLLFAILIGFFIATATTNYLRLQSLIAEEDAGLITIFNLTKNISLESKDKITEVIDTYAISALSFELAEYIDKTKKEFENLADVVDQVGFTDKKSEHLIGSLHDKKNSLYQTRQEIALVARRIVTSAHWIVLISLGILVGFFTLALRDGEVISSCISGILLATNYLLLTLLYEVDNNRFLEQALAYQNSQQIFEIIGRPPYYLADVIKSGRVKEPQTSYRTGYYKSSNDKEIKLVDPTSH